MSVYGWCIDGHHDNCRVSMRRWWWELKGKKWTRVFGDEDFCECRCHNPSKSVKKRAARRKK